MAGIRLAMKVILTGIFFCACFLCRDAALSENGNKVKVYYFYTSTRCPTCYKLERYTEDALKKNFSKELSSGTLAFKTVNVEKQENDHFIREYGLYTKSVVLSLLRGGKEVKFKNLDKVWQYVGDREAFSEYVCKEVKVFLDEIRGE